MVNTRHNLLTVNKAHFLMVGWGLAILIGSILNQFIVRDTSQALVLWAIFSLLGLASHALCYFRGLGKNFGTWMALIGVGWVFTIYVQKINTDFSDDLPGVWLILLGIGYVVTALQIDRRFFYLALISFVVGGVLELSARAVINVDFLYEYSTIIFGLFAGLPPIVASLPVFYRASQPKPKPSPAPATQQ